MNIVLDQVTKGVKEGALPATSTHFETGTVSFVRAETEQRPSVLGLIASGRMRPDSGSVTIDGETDYAELRRRVALIDAPDVCEPAADVAVTGVIAEELMFAGRPSHPVAARRAAVELGVGDYAHHPIGNLPPTKRIALLTELAVMRRGVEGLVITSPDRHGGDPLQWWNVATGLAERGYAVLVVAGDASAAAIAAATGAATGVRTDADGIDTQTADAEGADTETGPGDSETETANTETADGDTANPETADTDPETAEAESPNTETMNTEGADTESAE